MNSIHSIDQSGHALHAAARHAYNWGHEKDAARLYLELAEFEKQGRRTAAELNARRWAGNSLMWDGEVDAALRLLLDVATSRHPDADPDPVYGAKTDIIMLSLQHAPASVCHAQLTEARSYLEQMGKSAWRHRLEMLRSILLFKQGRFEEAAEAAILAWRLKEVTTGGPTYADLAYFKWISRPLFFLRRREPLMEWTRAASQLPVTMLSDRLRLSCMRLMCLRLERAAGGPAHGMLEEARAAARVLAQVPPTYDEVFEVRRALVLAGDWTMVDKLGLEPRTTFPYERSLFEVDQRINLLRGKLGLPPWDPDLDWPHELPVRSQPADGTSNEREGLANALHQLSHLAHYQDERLATTHYRDQAGVRKQHADALLNSANARSCASA